MIGLGTEPPNLLSPVGLANYLATETACQARVSNQTNDVVFKLVRTT